MEIIVNILRKLGLISLICLGASLALFTMINLMEGDPVSLRMKNPDPEKVAIERERLGLNDPAPIRYVHYITDFVTGNWGRSLITQRKVSDDIFDRLTATLELGVSAMILGVLMGVPIAMFSVSRGGIWIFKKLAHGVGVLGVVMPIFCLGLILMVIFSVWLEWFPLSGRFDFAYDKPSITGFLLIDVVISGRFDLLPIVFSHLALPVLCLSFYPAAVVVNVLQPRLQDPATRNLMVSLRARGFGVFRIWMKHMLKIGAAPLVTALGTNFGALLAGAVLTETVFSWPGMGTYLVHAILEKDVFVIENGFLFLIMLVFVVVLITDTLALALDPTVKKGSH